MRILAIMIVIFGGAVSTTFASDNFPVNVYPCSRAVTAPVLDGKLDDAVWQQCHAGFRFHAVEHRYTVPTGDLFPPAMG